MDCLSGVFTVLKPMQLTVDSSPGLALMENCPSESDTAQAFPETIAAPGTDFPEEAEMTLPDNFSCAAAVAVASKERIMNNAAFLNLC